MVAFAAIAELSIAELPSAGGAATYDESVSDTAKGSDSVAAQLDAVGAATDTGVASDSATGGADYDASAAETAKGSDSVSEQLDAAAAASDTAKASGTASGQRTTGVPTTDTGKASDAAEGNVDGGASASDTAVAGDAVADDTGGGTTHEASTADTAKGSDAAASQLDAIAAAADQARAADAVASDLQAGASIADTGKAGDTALGGKTFDDAVSDQARAADSALDTMSDALPCRERVMAAAAARLGAIASIPGLVVERERTQALNDAVLPFVGLFEGDVMPSFSATGEQVLALALRVEGYAAGASEEAAEASAAEVRARVEQALFTEPTLGGIVRRIEDAVEPAMPQMVIDAAGPVAAFAAAYIVEYAIREADPFRFAAEAA